VTEQEHLQCITQQDNPSLELDNRWDRCATFWSVAEANRTTCSAVMAKKRFRAFPRAWPLTFQGRQKAIVIRWNAHHSVHQNQATRTVPPAAPITAKFLHGALELCNVYLHATLELYTSVRFGGSRVVPKVGPRTQVEKFKFLGYGLLPVFSGMHHLTTVHERHQPTTSRRVCGRGLPLTVRVL